MRKWIIETMIIGIALGSFMFYGQPLVDYIQNLLNLAPSSYLYGVIGICVMVLASIAGKIITRGMK